MPALTEEARKVRINAADRLIVALDSPNDLRNPDRLISAEDARKFVRDLGGLVSFFKIGWPLYMAEGGHRLPEDFVEEGKRVFLDLKYGDITETVKRVVMTSIAKKVSFITVNTTFQTVRAAVEARGDSALKILTVTLLTSLNEDDLRSMGVSLTVPEFVREKTRQAIQAKCDGVIASGREVADIRTMAGKDFLIVTPGIRPAGAGTQDHKRATTPTQAIAAGSDYLVVGRPITQAESPRDAAGRIVEEMQRAFDAREA